MRLVCFSDTHGCHPYINIPDGDILIFAGDMCSYGRGKEAKRFINWMRELPHIHKIFIAGNHDWPFYKDRGYGNKDRVRDMIYLQDESAYIGSLKIYGSPWQPEFCDWAFNLPRGEALKKKWDKIPEDTDILITHGPPVGVLDTIRGECITLGCVDLKHAVKRVKPKVHVFGHIHSAHGVREREGIVYINCSIVGDYNTTQERDPIIFDI